MVDTIPAGVQPASIAVSGNNLYVANFGSDNMMVFDMVSPSSAIPVDTIGTGDGPGNVAVSGNFAYVASVNDDIMRVYNIGNPGSVVAVDTIMIGSNPTRLSVTGDHAYFSCSLTGSMKVYKLYCPGQSLGINPGTGNLQSLETVWNTLGPHIVNANSGNVGIGTVSPTAKLEINGGDMLIKSLS